MEHVGGTDPPEGNAMSINEIQNIEGSSPEVFHAAAMIEALFTRPVSAVYSGRIGCACGCQGNHTSRPASITRVKNQIAEAIRHGKVTWFAMTKDMVAIDTETRSYVAYTDGRVS
ncbi:hypothetical protein AUDREY_103 [Mycobacterium phage Audrey]|uniref:Uncharacterized protein n=1 Tax=Mycobacterium phage Audrey TaxID=1458709 RepID=X2KSI8_9CAUD|nr:hypothetical protein AUDREY_103 [Mycobacterium phage Audrey]